MEIFLSFSEHCDLFILALSSNKSSELSTDFNLPIADRANITSPFTSLLDITENYVSSSIPYYDAVTQDTLNNNHNGTLPHHSNDYILRPPFNHYPRIPNNIIDQTAGIHAIQSTYSNGFQIPTATPSTTSHFQLMPHLMNSFI